MPREDEDGNAFSLCAFSNGIACEVTDFFNGDCQP
jgi:putative hemolysin